MMRRNTLLALLTGLILLAGCAKLPLDNGAPGAPDLTLAGTAQVNSVPIEVKVDDPDGDRVTLHFMAENTTGQVQDFSWTSFIDSGKAEVFTLGLGAGQWTITARAKDEWEELSGWNELEVTVGF